MIQRRRAIVSFLFLSIFFSVVASAKEGWQKARVRLGKVDLEVEVATTMTQKSVGLSKRPHLAQNAGMLFVFSDERERSFWMKDTLIPLAIGFFDESGKLIDIQEMSPPSVIENEPPRYVSRKPARLALEVNKGWFAQHKIHLGAQLEVLPGKVPSELEKWHKRSRPKSN